MMRRFSLGGSVFSAHAEMFLFSSERYIAPVGFLCTCRDVSILEDVVSL